MYRNKDVVSTSTACKALFQGPNHQFYGGQALVLAKPVSGVPAENKQLQGETSIHDDGSVGLTNKDIT